MSNIEKYKRVFSSVFGSSNVETLKFGDDGWNSAGHFELLTAIEKEFLVHLETDEMMSFVSFAEGIKILEKHDIKF